MNTNPIDRRGVVAGGLLALHLLLAGNLHAQTAQFQTFGQGCAFNGQAAAIGIRQMPTLGRTCVATYSGPNQAQPQPAARQSDIQPFLALGLLPSLPILLPGQFAPQQPNDCAMLVAAEVVIPTARALSQWPISVFEGHVDLPIPLQPTLAGAVFFAQWWVPVRDSYTGVWYAALASDAAMLVVGR